MIPSSLVQVNTKIEFSLFCLKVINNLPQITNSKLLKNVYKGMKNFILILKMKQNITVQVYNKMISFKCITSELLSSNIKKFFKNLCRQD